MAMNFTRRDMLKLAGGSALGFIFTPIPWKALDDLSIWTQNWSSIPKPLRGDIKTKYTVCTLCPAGCALRARCVGEQPVGLFGVPAHPLSHGVVCPIGLTGHHLAYHPLRATQPLKLTQHRDALSAEAVPVEEAVASISGTIAGMTKTGGGESVAVLDERPGRVTSLFYKEFLAGLPNGIYLHAPSRESATLDAMQTLFDKPYESLGLDLENARTILSFGAPILDGWGTPGRIVQRMKDQSQLTSEKKLNIIQIETRQSRTALFADRWLPIKPGAEAALALGLAHVLIGEKLHDDNLMRRSARDFDGREAHSYYKLVEQFTPARVAEITGIDADRIAEVARDAAQNGPTLVIGGGDPGAGPLGKDVETAIAGLNILLGNVGKSGGILPRRELPVPAALVNQPAVAASEFEAIPDHSIRVLIMDAAESGSALPWPLIEKKLVPENALVVSLSPYLAGHAKRANFLIPAPAHFESLQEVPGTFDGATASFNLSAALLTPPGGVVEPVDFINRLAGALGFSLPAQSAEELLKGRVEAIYQTGRGSVFTFSDGQSSDLSSIGSAEQLWEMLANGATWFDSEMSASTVPQIFLLGKSADGYERLLAAGAGRLTSTAQTTNEYPLVLMPFGWRGAVGNGQLSPLMSKLYQESGLRDLARHALIHPTTAAAHGLVDGLPAQIKTPAGMMKIEIHFDAAAMPGVVHVAVGPTRSGAENGKNHLDHILSICSLDQDTTWRVTPAQVVKA